MVLGKRRWCLGARGRGKEVKKGWQRNVDLYKPSKHLSPPLEPDC